MLDDSSKHDPYPAPITNSFPSATRTSLDEKLVIQESCHSDSDRLRPQITPLDDCLEESAEEDDEGGIEGVNNTICGPSVPTVPSPQPSSSVSTFREPAHAIATPRPTLLFAIASDDVNEVRRVLESGEAGPNDDAGPQSALEFALTAEQLKHRVDIVKLLLAHGANPSLPSAKSGRASRASVALSDVESGRATPAEDVLAGIDPATRQVECSFQLDVAHDCVDTTWPERTLHKHGRPPH